MVITCDPPALPLRYTVIVPLSPGPVVLIVLVLYVALLLTYTTVPAAAVEILVRSLLVCDPAAVNIIRCDGPDIVNAVLFGNDDGWLGNNLLMT